MAFLKNWRRRAESGPAPRLRVPSLNERPQPAVPAPPAERHWQPHQVERLAYERALLAKHMPDFAILAPRADTHVLGSWVSALGNDYQIRIDLPAGYPDECPSTYIMSPSPLLDHDGQPMTHYETSNAQHTWATDRPGCVKICTYRPESWDASSSVIQLIQKAMLWLMAYDEHQRRGTPINEILLEMS